MIAAVACMASACVLNTEGAFTTAEGGSAGIPDAGIDSAYEASPDASGGTAGDGGSSGFGGVSGMGGSSGVGGSAGSSGSAGQGGSAGAGGSSGDGGSAGIAGTGGVSGAGGAGGSSGSGGNAGSAGSGGSGGGPADAGDADAPDAPDAADVIEEPDAPWPTSPCGPYPPTGYAVCWVYPHSAYPSLLVGLAGAVATPGHFVNLEWKDPMVGNVGNCVAGTASSDSVICTFDELPVGSTVEFVAGMHQSQSSPTESGTFACNLTQCSGEVYAFHNGVEIGKYVNGQAFGKVHTVPHFVPNTRLNLAFNITL